VEEMADMFEKINKLSRDALMGMDKLKEGQKKEDENRKKKKQSKDRKHTEKDKKVKVTDDSEGKSF
jgi:hypothetical protein